jgi:protein TonB
VPIGLPLRDEGRRTGAIVSVLVHALIIGLLIVPLLLPSSVIRRMQEGAGGAGPAGGGGGGRGGTGGGTVESLRFVRLAPEPVPTPSRLPDVPVPPVPTVEPPKPKPVETPPPATPEPQAATPAPPATVASATPGANGGSGRDGSAGAGPGSGGGTGSGIGTGTGSANGPGTGGGNGANYMPTPTQFFLPPLPPPANVRGFRFTAEFDVDSTGRVIDFTYTKTPNGDYNRSLASVLRSVRFRPGTRPDGTPVRMKAQVTYDF